MTSSARRTTRVAVGDTVVWKWLGPRGNHSVTADPGQAESFDSDPGKAPQAIAHPAGHTFTHLFTKTGPLHLRLPRPPGHAGEVTVIALPPRDVKRPALSKLSVRPGRVCPAAPRPLPRHPRLRCTCRSPSAATVVGRIDRAAGAVGISCARSTSTLRKGRARHRLYVRGFEPGPYRLRLVAYDYANNRSPSKRVRFRVGRP